MDRAAELTLKQDAGADRLYFCPPYSAISDREGGALIAAVISVLSVYWTVLAMYRSEQGSLYNAVNTDSGNKMAPLLCLVGLYRACGVVQLLSMHGPPHAEALSA